MNDPGIAANSQLALTSANIQSGFASLALPAIRQVAGHLISDLGSPGTEPASVRAAFDDARANTISDYESSGRAAAATLDQQIKQSGGLYNPAAKSDAVTSLASSLTKSRASSLRSLAFQEAQTGQAVGAEEENMLLGLGANTMQGSLMFGQNAASSNDLLSQIYARRRQSNSTYGAMAGTILGGIIGTVAGGNTLAGAGIGGAIGGAAGGML